jgi:hypothetical protein
MSSQYPEFKDDCAQLPFNGRNIRKRYSMEDISSQTVAILQAPPTWNFNNKIFFLLQVLNKFTNHAGKTQCDSPYKSVFKLKEVKPSFHMLLLI